MQQSAVSAKITIALFINVMVFILSSSGFLLFCPPLSITVSGSFRKRQDRGEFLFSGGKRKWLKPIRKGR
jgi:hypothetical protein